MNALAYLASILKTDLATCADITRQIIRVVHTQRELSVGYFGKVIKSFGVGARHDGRVNEYINALCQLKWIIVIKAASEKQAVPLLREMNSTSRLPPPAALVLLLLPTPTCNYVFRPTF